MASLFVIDQNVGLHDFKWLSQ